MSSLKPMLLTCMKTYSREQFVKDVTAGIIVAIIALPLSIALALASGVGPEAGIFTAIVAGFVISALGGSSVQIAGPTAAFATIVAGIVAKNGLDGLVIATILAGIFLILMGLCHFGTLIRFIPYTITTGFTAGIAVTIVIGQLKDFFGVTYPDGVKPIETMEKLHAFVENCGTVNLSCNPDHFSLYFQKDSGFSAGCGRRNPDGKIPSVEGFYHWRSVFYQQCTARLPSSGIQPYSREGCDPQRIYHCGAGSY